MSKFFERFFRNRDQLQRSITVGIRVEDPDGTLGIDRAGLVARLSDIVTQFDSLHAARHGAITRARLPPCAGAPTPCRIVEPGEEGDGSIIAAISTSGPSDIATITLHHRHGSTELVEPVRLSGRPEEGVSIAGEVAAKIWTSVVPDLPLTGWQAAAAFGRGLITWAVALERNAALADEEAGRIRADLEQALEGDHRNPVIRYNLGALLYERYQEDLAEEAVRHFTIAFSASFGDDSDEVRFVAGLALTGLSLTYGQLHHRFGRTTDEVLVNARISARRAVEMLDDLHRRSSGRNVMPALLRARYAEAFSLHLTEAPEDIEAAISIYRDIIDGWEGFSGEAPAVILNNLGYQYMALEGREEPGCHPEVYERAEAMFLAAIDADPNFEMAWANLGNIQRLTKRHEESERSYLRALAAARAKDVKYPPAHSELARLQLERGNLEEAEGHHQSAIEAASSDAVEARVKGEWAAGLRSINLRERAAAAAEEGLALNPDEARCLDVLRWATSSTAGHHVPEVAR